MDIAKLAGLPARPIIRQANELVVSDRNCGIEIEIENVDRREMARQLNTSLWEVTTDHSLRPVDYSAEIRSAKGGLCGKQLLDSIEQASKIDISSRGGPHFSWRTGLHVHVDVRDKTPEDMKVLATHYSILEPYIFNWAGAGRWESRFSMPWWVVSGDIGRLSYANETQRGARETPFVSAMSHFSKYTALNFAPTMRQGSVEFRHAQGTNNRTALIHYVNIGLSIVEAAVATGEKDQCAEIIAYYTEHGPVEYMRKYFNPTLTSILCNGLNRMGERPLTQPIIDASVNTAIQIAELGDRAAAATVRSEDLEIVDNVIAGKNNAARRARSITFN